MDEPFSAVDPVVRESLQDELLRLQAELGKTIVFVTHDIDEAVKLGDKVAVFRVGGKLAQYDEPGELLARPADDFVDAFVGRDRGYRGLGFLSSDAAAAAASCPRSRSARARPTRGWALVLDADGRPLGWLHDRARRRHRRTRATSCPAARCTTRAPARCAARSTRRCPRRPGRGSRSTATGGSVGVGRRRRRAARRSPTPGAPRRPEVGA